MSRSNPNADRIPNPAERFFEWKGGDGILKYYDKEEEKDVTVKLPFTFIVLDQLATIKGYNKKLKSGIYSNEVRDTRSDRLVVKYFKGGKIAEGFYADIKDMVTSKSVGGHFVSNVYIAFKDGKAGSLKLGAIQFQGCSLGPWFEFVKENRKEIYEKAVVIAKGEKNDEGEIEFIPPIYGLKDITKETEAEAKKIDARLQEYLKGYFGRSVTDRVATRGEEHQHRPEEREPDPEPESEPELAEDDVPF